MNTLKKILLSVPCLFFFTIAYSAQYNDKIDSTFTISGKVIDSITGQPVHLVSIYLLDDGNSTIPVKTAMTNETGGFNLEFNHSPFYLKFSFIGYEPLLKRIQRQNGRTLDIGIVKLKEIDNKLEEVTVTAKRPTLELITGGYKFNATNNIIGNSTNIAELLKQVPGLTVDEMEGKLQLLGKGPTVLVNGRKVNMGGKDLLTYLRSLPSNDVLSINVLTNPGSEYDSSGDGGVLDIRLKKNSNLGFFGSASTSVSTLWGTDESINLNLKKSNLEVSVGYNFSYAENLYRRNDVIKNYVASDSSYLYRQQQEIDRSQRTHAVKTNVNYNIDSTSTIGFGYWYAYLYSLDPIQRNADIFDRSDKFQRQVKQNDRNFLDNNFHIVDLTYDKDFSKASKLSIGLNYSKYSNENNMSFTRQAYDQSGSEINSLENESRNLIIKRPYDIWTLNADYKKAIGENYELKFGGKYNRAKTESAFTNLSINGNSPENEGSNNEIEYNENVKAIYSSFGGKHDRISFEAGLRLEAFDYKLRSLLTGEQIKNDYLNLFPNFSLRFDSEDGKNSVSLAGNRRIERPGYSMLNPFVVDNNLGYLTNGNPNLRPYFTNRLDAQYSHRFNDNHSLIFSLYASSSKDMFDNITRYNGDQGSAEINYYNDFTQKQIGGYLMLQNQFGKLVNISTYLSAQRPSFKSYVPEDDLLPGITNFSGSMNIFVKVLPKTTVQLLGFYSSDRNNFQVKYAANGYLTLGVQQKAVEDKLNIALTCEDIFNLQKYPVSSISNFLSIESVNKLTSRYLKLSLSYNFGKSFSAKQSRKLQKESRID
ncbi:MULTISPECIES: outer membrane beta-barrel protein [unclassified Sphingobacterium]|uniref:outer membrane beta-barrel protein n=1 Tax=unclassified Sphingobacterium TaxID=2609468 RepID=UPI0025E1C450|nr:MULTISPECIES: outer membrane beta-barrel protein [unclassified Sphingobacterium]